MEILMKENFTKVRNKELENIDLKILTRYILGHSKKILLKDLAKCK